ncbi:MAG TPA: hypothetical protein VFM70_12845 [Salinimicrobium sp.]|nr:hypothetical protein [Salinimicrobium sp.]
MEIKNGTLNWSEIAIISTITNFPLYSKTRHTFPEEIQHFIIDGRNGMYGINSLIYLFKKLRNSEIRWLVMADEDVIFQNTESLFATIKYMAENNYHYSGVREGGVIPHRKYNPHAVNTFFSILKFSEIKKIFPGKGIKKQQFIKDNEFGEDLSALKNSFDVKSLFEPYYCFYFWLKRSGFNLLPLDANVPFSDDSLTTAVYAPDGKIILYHTWYARAYGEIEKHTKRINNVLNQVPISTKPLLKPIIYKDINYGWKLKLRKKWKKLKMKFQ